MKGTKEVVHPKKGRHRKLNKERKNFSIRRSWSKSNMDLPSKLWQKESI
jgi:hypothetical protein